MTVTCWDMLATVSELLCAIKKNNSGMMEANGNTVNYCINKNHKKIRRASLLH